MIEIPFIAFHKLSVSTMSETAVIDVLSHSIILFVHTFIDSIRLYAPKCTVYMYEL